MIISHNFRSESVIFKIIYNREREREGGKVKSLINFSKYVKSPDLNV